MIEFRAPFFGWWLLVLAAVAVTLVVIGWRRGWQTASVLASASVLLGTGAALFWMESRNAYYYAQIAAIRAEGDGSTTGRHLRLWSMAGGIQCEFWQGHYVDAVSVLRLHPPTPPDIVLRRVPDDGRHYPLWREEYSITRSDFVEKTLGFQVCWWSDPGPGTTELHCITIPIWFVILLCVPLPAIWLRRRLRRRYRLRHGLCIKCGYDLRATPASGKCQECGTQVPHDHRPTISPAPTPATTPHGR